jgi:two-component system LytT family response regulator
MTLTCYIVDDEPHALALLNDYILQTPGLTLAGSSLRPLEALNEITARPPDITFLDVDMPDLNGIELAGLVRGLTTVVFTTSFREYGPEAFEKNAADYLLKPVSLERFLQCIRRVRDKLSPLATAATERPYIFIKTDVKGKLVRVELDRILYIEGMSNYLMIHLAGEKICAYLTLAELLEQLPAGRFSRIHKSYIVANGEIRSMEQGQVGLSDNVHLPIGRAFAAAFQQQMRPHLLLSKRDPAH